MNAQHIIKAHNALKTLLRHDLVTQRHFWRLLCAPLIQIMSKHSSFIQFSSLILFIVRHLTKSLYMKRISYIESMPCRAYTGWLHEKKKKKTRTEQNIFISHGVSLRHNTSWFKQHAHAHRGGKKGPLFHNTGPREESKTEMRGRRRPRGVQHEVVMRSEVVEESCEEEK